MNLCELSVQKKEEKPPPSILIVWLIGWLISARCDSYVKMYLPDSLKETDQPEPQPDACILKDVNIIETFQKKFIIQFPFLLRTF